MMLLLSLSAQAFAASWMGLLLMLLLSLLSLSAFDVESWMGLALRLGVATWMGLLNGGASGDLLFLFAPKPFSSLRVLLFLLLSLLLLSLLLLLPGDDES